MENTNIERSVNGRLSLLRTLRHRFLPPQQPDTLWLSAYQPQDHLQLLRWVIFNPIQLKNYKRRLNNAGRFELRRLGGWLSSTLIWAAMLLWFLLLWVTGVAQIHWAVGILLIVGLILAWQTTGRWMHRKSAKASGLALMVSIPITVLTTTFTLGLVPGGNPPALPSIVGGYLALLLMMMALAVVNVLNLEIGDGVVTVVSISFGGSVVIASVLNGLIGVPFDVFILIVAVFLPGVIQQRFLEAKAENPFKQNG